MQKTVRKLRRNSMLHKRIKAAWERYRHGLVVTDAHFVEVLAT